MLVALVGTGLYLTIRLRGLQGLALLKDPNLAERFTEVLSKDPDPDLLVNYSVTVQKVQKVSTIPAAGPPPPYYYRGSYYGTWPSYSYETWVREYDEGTLLIDVVDAKRHQLVWEAAGTGRLKKALTEDTEARARSAVALLFARYPFRAGSGSG